MQPDKILAQSESNFNIAFWGLPKDQRRALTAIYAFCRVVDDAVDESPDDGVAQESMAELRSQLASESSPESILFAELRWSMQRFSMQVSNLYWLMDGVLQDLTFKRYQSWDELFAYCDAVATSVGYMCMEIFGQQVSAPCPYVVATGRALQLTNIARDVFVDGSINRVYIPQEHWSKYNVSEASFLSGQWGDGHELMMKDFLDVAKSYYQVSEQEKNKLDARKIWPAEVMKHVYFEIWKTIEKKPSLVHAEKVSVASWKKVWISRRQYMRSLF